MTIPTDDQIYCAFLYYYEKQNLQYGSAMTRANESTKQIMDILNQYPKLKENVEYYQTQSNQLLKRIIELEHTIDKIKGEFIGKH